MLALGSMYHIPERLSPALVLAHAIVLEEQFAVAHDDNAMDIGLMVPVEPFDESVKRLVPATTGKFLTLSSKDRLSCTSQS